MKRIAAFVLALPALVQPCFAETLRPEAARHAAQGLVAEVLEALARQNFRKLASFVDQEGLTVSPYVTLDKEDVRLAPTEVKACAEAVRVRLWGHYDGSGNPIKMTCSQYFSRFVWEADYRKADEVLYNEPRQRGNDINNNHAFAPDSIVVELHVRGEGAEAFATWKSLRLIFRRSGQGLSLLAITRDVWTI